MSRSVFVDSSAWYSLIEAGDTNHREAVRLVRNLFDQRRTLLTTNHVISESYTLLRSRLGRRAAQEFLGRTHSGTYMTRVFVPESWEEAAEDLLAEYDDQDFSYVDATSFVAMRRLGLREALAFDRQFSTMGFSLIA